MGYDLSLIDPAMLGIEWRSVPRRPTAGEVTPSAANQVGPLPGWYVVSVNWLHDREHRYDYFHDLEPVDWVGYTMPIYHITLEQANALRRRYGMAELPNDAEAPPASAPAVPTTSVSLTGTVVK